LVTGDEGVVIDHAKLTFDKGILSSPAMRFNKLMSNVDVRGNIIKNEVLYIVKAHPLQLVSQFTPKEQRALVKATRDYSQNFYIWKKAYVLRKHWLVYKRKFCPNCERPLLIEWLGKTERKTYYCGNCQGMKRAGTYNSK
jgi:formamidopyrimidine-DNA glycosylase